MQNTLNEDMINYCLKAILCRYKEWICEYTGEGKIGVSGEKVHDIYTTMCQIYSWLEFAITQGASLGLCDYLEG